MSVSDLPALNASFNLVSTIFISMGWYFIRHGAWRRHMACMITAVISSACFLVGYIIYHALDHPNLAVCLGHRRACVFDALQMVSSGTVTVALWATPHVSANVSVVLPTGKRLQMHHAKSCARQLFDV